MNHPGYPHIPMLLSGSFKGEVGIKLLCQPLDANRQDRRNSAQCGLWGTYFVFK